MDIDKYLGLCFMYLSILINIVTLEKNWGLKFGKAKAG